MVGLVVDTFVGACMAFDTLVRKHLEYFSEILLLRLGFTQAEPCCFQTNNASNSWFICHTTISTKLHPIFFLHRHTHLFVSFGTPTTKPPKDHPQTIKQHRKKSQRPKKITRSKTKFIFLFEELNATYPPYLKRNGPVVLVGPTTSIMCSTMAIHTVCRDDRWGCSCVTGGQCYVCWAKHAETKKGEVGEVSVEGYFCIDFTEVILSLILVVVFVAPLLRFVWSFLVFVQKLHKVALFRKWHQ